MNEKLNIPDFIISPDTTFFNVIGIIIPNRQPSDTPTISTHIGCEILFGNNLLAILPKNAPNVTPKPSLNKLPNPDIVPSNFSL